MNETIHDRKIKEEQKRRGLGDRPENNERKKSMRNDMPRYVFLGRVSATIVGTNSV